MFIHAAVIIVNNEKTFRQQKSIDRKGDPPDPGQTHRVIEKALPDMICKHGNHSYHPKCKTIHVLFSSYPQIQNQQGKILPIPFRYAEVTDKTHTAYDCVRLWGPTIRTMPALRIIRSQIGQGVHSVISMKPLASSYSFPAR